MLRRSRDWVAMGDIPWQYHASEIQLLLLGDALEIGSSDNPGRMDSPGNGTSDSRSVATRW